MNRRTIFRIRVLTWALLVIALVAVGPWFTNSSPVAQAQAPKAAAAKPKDLADEKADAVLNSPSVEKPAAPTDAKGTATTQATLLELFHKGGPLMYPIVA